MNRRPNHPQGSGNNDRNRNRRRRGGGGSGGPQPNGSSSSQGGPRSPKQAQESQQAAVEVTRKTPPVLRRYGIIFYDTHGQAREDADNLLLRSKEVDQLNIVIRAEGTMDDPDLLQFGKVFAGEAWHLIHRRRVDDKWYDSPHE